MVWYVAAGGARSPPVTPWTLGRSSPWLASTEDKRAVRFNLLGAILSNPVETLTDSKKEGGGPCKKGRG